MNALYQAFMEHKSELFVAIGEHIQISFIALITAVVIAIPIAIYGTRHPRWAEGIIGVSAVLQTIPSLALLGLLIPFVGIGKKPAIIAIVIYSLLPILRNTYTGIQQIDRNLIEAADAMGMNGWQRLWRVELPLALPFIMSGIRTATVLVIGTTTLAALVGAGGLGNLILLGIDRNNHDLIILGAVPVALLAISSDSLLRFAGRTSLIQLRFYVGVGLICTILILVQLLRGTTGGVIVIGAKIGAEPEILINMYKLLIEQESNLKVQLKPGLGKTTFVFEALNSGAIDIYPEFTGTIVSTFLKENAVSTESSKVYEQARAGIYHKSNMILLHPMKYNNTYALAVPKQMAEEKQLKSISDLNRVSGEIRAGMTLEFSDREDGYRGIEKLYGLHFANIKTMEPKLRYTAIQTGDINLVDAYSTDSEIQQYQLTVLDDDKKLFPPYQGASLMKYETLKKHPELERILNKLGDKITDDEMRKMNYQVNVQQMSAGRVAEEYLKQAGLLQ
ncbi:MULTISPECIES: ABC transporter permease/substrate-binding protein [Paenibacillus]|uniref:ABC transporter permease/substrate-binding protein n=1 Tax=Paenibacillus violae TaxID=3077234 RepID=A0ABU3RKH9_9BACL|nr:MULTISPECIES: ABC transporter permease/substrate-binding protein [Paenibacillus]MDU0204800.1 ABC transporter permease/substrate-binding protein [Paenibacillus sp. PFR10]MEC0270515.1 ABC transporter permease/substrate-binding protein [Paenibacillus anseongense]